MRLAMVDNDRPYVVPLNYGYTYENGTLTLYFHCAAEGRKIDILKTNSDVCFEMDGEHKLIEGKIDCAYGYSFESVIGAESVSSSPMSVKNKCSDPAYEAPDGCGQKI